MARAAEDMPGHDRAGGARCGTTQQLAPRQPFLARPDPITPHRFTMFHGTLLVSAYELTITLARHLWASRQQRRV